MDIRDIHHPNGIWTWTGIGSRRRFSLWLPYLQEIHKKRGKWHFHYNGGDISTTLDTIDSILVYGASGTIPVRFLDELAQHRVPLMIHRRNMPHPMIFYPWSRTDNNDVLSRQILERANKKTSAYIARTLIRHRLQSFRHVVVSQSTYRQLNAARQTDDIRAIEAAQSRRFWRAYYKQLGFDGLTRREKHPVNQSLDALSFFMSGILLRWVLFHKLSPSHGFLHTPSNYTALVYDLMEPHRWIIEEAVADAVHELSVTSLDDNLTPVAVNKLKALLETTVYVPATRQTMARKNTLHGTVLALRSYLLKDTKRFVLPLEGAKKGGRPPKVAYKVPGGTNPNQ